MERPAAVVGIAGVFFLAAAYLVAIGLVMLVHPGLISMAAGADLLAGLELAGPYMFLLTGTVAAIIGYGLLRLNNYARRAAILVAIAGLVLLIPVVSRSVADFRFRALASRGVGVIVRVMIVWYLYQVPVREAFQQSKHVVGSKST